jgi:uncharacterized repeat protein (TIGR01451 family)
MKQKLLFYRRAGILLLLMINCIAYGQVIGIPAVSAPGGPIQISFSVSNGITQPAFFTDNTLYTVYLSNAAGVNFQPIYTFNSAMFPASTALASATVSQTVPIPAGTTGGTGYKVAVSAASPTSLGIVGANASAAFTLFSEFTVPVTLSGFIKCSSPSINYYVLTITNTGNLTDSYTFSKVQTDAPLESEFYSLTGAVITGTPSLDPGESYTFMMRFDTPNGTPPDQWNYTDVTFTSVVSPTVIHHTMISTYIYCGNNHPNLPDAPDLTIVKTANTATALVGNLITYTITIRNISTKVANNPVIRDFLPANVDIVSYAKAPGETRNVLFTYDAPTRTLTALVQSSMTSASVPLTINVTVRTFCQSVPQVVNSTEVYTVSGDSNPENDIASATTLVSYDVATADIGRWTGAYSNDWFDCRNWSGGLVPNNNTDVQIPNGTINSEISKLSVYAPADKIARAHHLNISGGATVSMTNAGLFHISGNWSSAGGFSAGNGHVTFMGSVAGSYQTIADTTDKVEFYDLTLDVSNSSKGLSVPTQFGLFAHNNLNLANGDIRLNGKSQLIQTKPGLSTNPVSGNGKIFVDQQGKTNVFSYNYWSSPVGANNTYVISNVLRDGTDPSNPLPINWSGGYNGSPTTPITLASYWLFTFQDLTSSFANWTSVGSNGTLLAGQGFLMKGSGAATPEQNKTIKGNPNKRHITRTVNATYMNLSGNPYPCALDAYAFIDENIQSTTGTLYFWEQFSTNSSHITANYEGGYATLTKTGTTPPVSPAGISSAGSSNRTPGRYIPVAQGFILFGSSIGGTIRYNNTQRAFVRESDPTSNPMFRTNDDDAKRIRLSFTSANVKRQLLLGFIGNGATDGFDKGYDAVQIDTQASDMYFPVSGQNLVIQAKGAFHETDVVPLGVQVGESGIIVITLDGTEHFATQEIVLNDAATGVSYDLTKGEARLSITAGTYDDRFTLRFTKAGNAEAAELGSFALLQSGRVLQIKNETAHGTGLVELFSITGQKIAQWDLAGETGDVSVSLPELTHGVYIAKASHGNKADSIKISIAD